MQKIRFAFKYLLYTLFSKHRKGYGVHSPFLYEFVDEVLYAGSYYYAFDSIKKLRNQLRMSKEKIHVLDLGAGSKKLKSEERKLSDIARFCSIHEKFGKMLFRIVLKYKAKTILELGTSLGLGTVYLASANHNAQLATIEGCPETAQKAAKNFITLGLNNISQIIGTIDKKLPVYLAEIHTLDLVYFDGNHTKDATLRYFRLCKEKAHNESIFFFDDIHWSRGMEQAWEIIQADKDVSLCIDLFFGGLVFFKKELSKECYTVKF